MSDFQPICSECRSDDGGESYICDPSRTLCPSFSAGPTTMHVMPVGDALDHVTADDCLCGPGQQAVVRDDGSVGWVVVHHSLDGRERFEA